MISSTESVHQFPRQVVEAPPVSTQPDSRTTIEIVTDALQQIEAARQTLLTQLTQVETQLTATDVRKTAELEALVDSGRTESYDRLAETAIDNREMLSKVRSLITWLNALPAEIAALRAADHDPDNQYEATAWSHQVSHAIRTGLGEVERLVPGRKKTSVVENLLTTLDVSMANNMILARNSRITSRVANPEGFNTALDNLQAGFAAYKNKVSRKLA